MEGTSDDPPESHDQSKDADEDVSIVHTWPPSTELANQTSDAAYNEDSDQDDTESEDTGADDSQTESKASEKSPCKMQQGAIFSGKILSFCCSECKGDTTYSPNDLLKHFQVAHKGTLPTYPCDLCTFVTNEFSSLQRHRIGHRDTLVTCEICNDGVQYSLLLLTRHFIMCHSCNGLFRCKKCDFSTRDAGTFVQHIHHHNESGTKCVRCPPLSPTQGKSQSGTFPFTCQFCGYGAARKEYLNKHLSMAHGDETDKTNRRKSVEDNTGVNSSGLKLLLKKSPASGGSRESQWMSKLNALPGVGLLDHNGRLFNPEKTLEETQQFLERAVGVKKESNKWTKGPLKSEPQCSYPVTPTTAQPKIQENELSSGSGLVNPSNSNGLTVLMVKNKISIPPNCTTKVMGFKMVDGKKHLVLKVIPTKQESSTKNEVSLVDAPEDDKKTPNSAKKTDFTASIKLEANDIERDTGDQSPLLHEHEASSIAADQVGDEVLEMSSQSPTPPSDLHFVDSVSTMTKEAFCFINQKCSPDRTSSQLHNHELPVPVPNSSADGSRSTNSQKQTATIPDGTVGEVMNTDLLRVKEAPSESLTKHNSGVNSESADEPTSPEAISNVRSCLFPVSANEDQPSALILNCIADEATPTPVSGESPGQMGHLVDNKCCKAESTEASASCERMTDQSSPRTNLKNSPTSISAEKQVNLTIVVDEDDTPLLNSPASSSNLTNGKSFHNYSLTDINDSSSSKELASNNTAVQSKSSRVTPNGTSSGESPVPADSNVDGETFQNSPSQEVFSFHNYSKDSFGSSPSSLEADNQSPEDFEEGCEEDFDDLKLSSDWSLTLPASPPLEQSEEENVGSGREGSAGGDVISASEKKDLERVSDSDIEVDECIATVDDELPLPVSLETEKESASLTEAEKLEEKGVSPASEKGPATLSNAAVLGKILEKHSDAIISQQLEKERMVSSAATSDAVRPTKTTLRILQTPEGKQQMFLQTTETPYAVPVQLQSRPGFKLITKSCASKVNVSYMKPGIERTSKGTGLSFTLNGGRIGMSSQGSSAEGEGYASLLQAVSSSGGRYLVNASSLKGPLLLSSAVKQPPSGEKTTNPQPPTCYLVQRPLPVAPVSSESTSSTKTVLTTRPVLAMPVNSSEKAAALQTGRQAYLVRYFSPAKSGILLNSSDGNGSNANEGGKNRVFLKVLRSPNGTRFLPTASPCTSAKKPIYVAASSLQSPCFLMSSNKALTSLSAGLKTSTTPKLVPSKLRDILPQSGIGIKSQDEDGVVIQKSSLIPMHIRQRSQRKRRRRAVFEEEFGISSKTRRISSKSPPEKEVSSLWEPAAKDVERTLRLSPFSPLQQIKCPRQNQPVVVLNHPDADIPEVANIMKSVNKYKSEVVKVSLSQSTVKALSEWSLNGPEGTLSKPSSRGQPLEPSVRERFILKLKLKKKSRRKYEVVRLTSSTGSEQMPKFSCWFCGRVFTNQEDWIGHGQRHLMEATRDWNKLF